MYFRKFNLRIVFGLFATILMSGCDGNYFTWSSDGKLAAMLGSEGLRFCDSEGNLSEIVSDKVGLLKFCPNKINANNQINSSNVTYTAVLASYEYISSWKELKTFLTKEEQAKVYRESLTLRKKILNYRGSAKKFADSSFESFSYPLEAALCLKDNANPEFLILANKKWTAFSLIKVPIFLLKECVVEGKQLKQSKTIDKGLDEIVEEQISANGKYIAFVKHNRVRDINYINVASLQNFSEKVLHLADDTNMYPAWSEDSHYLYFTQHKNWTDNSIFKNSKIKGGELLKIDPFDRSGKLVSINKKQVLAELIFQSNTPVKISPEGHVLFLSSSIEIPSLSSKLSESKIFSYNPKLNSNCDYPSFKNEIVLKKEDDVRFFELNPNGELIAFTTSSGKLYICKSNGENITQICNGTDNLCANVLPQWRSNNELSFGLKQISKDGKKNFAVVLWSNGKLNELSKSWSKVANDELSCRGDFFQDAFCKMIDQTMSNEHK